MDGASETRSKDYYAATIGTHVIHNLDQTQNGKASQEQQSVLHALVLMLAGVAVEREGSVHGPDKYQLFSKLAADYASRAAPAILREYKLELSDMQLKLMKFSDLNFTQPFRPNPEKITGWEKYIELRRELYNTILPVFRRLGGSKPIPSGTSLIELFDKLNDAAWEIEEGKVVLTYALLYHKITSFFCSE